MASTTEKNIWESMKATIELGFVLLLTTMLLAISYYLGWRVAAFSAGFSAMWFTISMVLLARPPGVPEFVSEESGSDEQFVVRRDVVPQLPLFTRFRLSLGVACGTCLLVWVTLGVLAI